MLFNSIEFLAFLPIVFILYWFAFGKNLRLQNLFVVVASYFFYGWWDWRFLILIAFTSFCSWGSGILIRDADGEKKRHAKLFLALNITLNLLILGIFKYYDFFPVFVLICLFHADQTDPYSSSGLPGGSIGNIDAQHDHHRE